MITVSPSPQTTDPQAASAFAAQKQLLERLFGHSFDICTRSSQGSPWQSARGTQPPIDSQLLSAYTDHPSVLREVEPRHCVVVIPIPQTRSAAQVAAIAVIPGAANADLENLAAAASLLLRERLAKQEVESERDALADQITQNFEELHWLRNLATALSGTDARTDMQTAAFDVLQDLRDLVRAEAVVVVADALDDGERNLGGNDYMDVRQTAWAGDNPLNHVDFLSLMAQIRTAAVSGPIVFNTGSTLQSVPLQTSARNVVAVPLVQSRTSYGWLIALNRVLPSHAEEQHPSDLLSPEFGSLEVGLLTTVATMLAGHARNVHLFRAEENLRVSVIEAMTGALDARDPYTCGHSQRVGQFASRIAARLGLPADFCERIYITGLVHDVGKIGVPDDILKKPGRLTNEEFDVIKQHPTIGHAILKPLKGLSYVLPGVLYHHERIDGRGYPDRLSGDEIPFDARILAVADGYDAMTSNRAYRDGMSLERAVQILQENAGEQWDRDVVEAFVTNCDEITLGTR